MLRSDGGISATRIRAFIKKNLALCFRDFTFMFFMFLFPMMAATIFNLAIGGNIKNVNVAVQNEETADCHRGTTADGCLYDNDNNLTLSCEVLNALRHLEYNLITVDNREAGDVLVEKVDSIAFIKFPQNFTKALQQYALGISFDSNQTYSPELLVYANIDGGNLLIKNEIIRNIYNIFNNVIVNSTRNCDVRFVNNPYRIKHLVGDKVVKFTHSIATIFVSMIGFYFSCAMSTEFMLTEKMEGILDRSMTAGITILEVIISITSIQTVVHIIQTVLVMFMTYVVFDNPIEITNGLFAFTFIIVLTGWLGLIYGFLIVGLSKSSSEAMNMVISWTTIQLYLSGIMWPIEAQMPSIKIISEHLPVCYICRLLNDIVLRGWTIGHPTVMIGVASIFGYVFLHVMILLYLTRLKKDAWLVKK